MKKSKTAYTVMYRNADTHIDIVYYFSELNPLRSTHFDLNYPLIFLLLIVIFILFLYCFSIEVGVGRIGGINLSLIRFRFYTKIVLVSLELLLRLLGGRRDTIIYSSNSRCARIPRTSSS